MPGGLEAITKGDGKPKEVDISDLTEEELRLVEEGKQNYRGEAFMEHILPAYMALKQGYKVPSTYLELVVKYPKKIHRKYQPKLDRLAVNIGNELREYKEALDNNRMVAVNAGMRVTANATMGAIKAKLNKAKEDLIPKLSSFYPTT